MSEKGLADGEKMFDLDDFVKVKELGAGSQGVVNEVAHKDSGQHYALKMQKLQQEEDVRKKQVLELRTLRNSRHRNVVALVDAFYKEGYVYTLMELMDCGSLQGVLKSAGALPEPIVGQMAVQLLDGLEYMHKTFHVLHRDIKPANVLLNKDGHVKLSDFGVIGKVDSTLGNATTYTGSSAYMSPERVHGQAHNMNSDCWSLGLILLECALGYYPFCDPSLPSPKGAAVGNLTVFQLMRCVSESDPCVSLDRLKGGYSDLFHDFIRKCLSRDPSKRPSSSELQAHPWIVQCKKDKKTDMKKWLAKVMDKNVETKK